MHSFVELLCIMVLEKDYFIYISNNPLLPYECLLDNTILLISTSTILIGFSFSWKAFLLTQSSPKLKTFLCHFYTM